MHTVTDHLHGRESDTTFQTVAGELTAYALACGYTNVHHDWDTNVRTTLWGEGGVYHVRQHDHAKHERIFWDTFDTLTPARKRYRAAIR